MKPTSQVIMGATLVMAASLAIVLALVLVLLAELYCSLLLRRCRQPKLPIDSSPPPSTAIVKVGGASTPLGVLDAPRSLLLPSLSPIQKELLAITSGGDQNLASTPPCQLGLLPAPPSPALTPLTLSYSMDEHLVYISNPIYNDVGTEMPPLRTPFETPDTSPSRMESVGRTSSSDDGEIEHVLTRRGSSSPPAKDTPLPATPPLSPMRKARLLRLLLQPSSVSLHTSGSGYSNSNNGVFSSTPGSGTTPCTSPSW